MAFWTLLNPLLLMLTYFFVFGVVLNARFGNDPSRAGFALYFLAGMLLLAFVSTDFLGGTNTTVTGVSGGGVPWVLVGRTNVQSGTAEVWRAFAPAPLTNAVVGVVVYNQRTGFGGLPLRSIPCRSS